MNVNKKLDRFKQWAGERMGGEDRTNTSDEFKAMETEMALRHEGMEKLQKSMTVYVKSLSKRSEMDDREKTLPVSYLGATMVSHGEDFEPDSEFGNCLLAFGRANERIGRLQETYVADATTSWLESTDRSVAQMKEYQAARKKLETRRLAYDASLSKMQKAKKEDFRVEEELRAQKAKYEESSDEVYRRMEDVKSNEVENVAELTAFVEAELEYYERCRDVLLQLKQNWPARTVSSAYDGRRGPRSRSNTAHDYEHRYNPPVEDEPLPEPKFAIPRLAGSRGTTPGQDQSPDRRPPYNRSSTFEGPTRLPHRDMSPAPLPRLTRVPTEPTAILANRSQLRPVKTRDTFADPSDESYQGSSSSPYRGRSPSPATSYGSNRSASWNTYETNNTNNPTKKGPPPPPPSRSKKPPPPPPMKRSALSTTEHA